MIKNISNRIHPVRSHASNGVNKKFGELENLLEEQKEKKEKEGEYTAGDLAHRIETGQLPEAIDLEFNQEDIQLIYQQNKEKIEKHIRKQTNMNWFLWNLSSLLQIDPSQEGFVRGIYQKNKGKIEQKIREQTDMETFK